MSKLHLSFIHRRARRERGQSMVEMALAFPILLLVLAGTLEVGMYFNVQLTLLDATREAARYAADGDINLIDATNAGNCDEDYYYQAACLLRQNLYGVTFNETTDDIIVSTFTIDSTGHVRYRFPFPCSDPYYPGPGYPQLCDSNVETRNQGWSLQKHRLGGAGAYSYFTNDAIENLLPDNMPPGAGLVVVEIYHLHHQFLGLIPPGMPFLPQEVMMHAYTMMPVPSAAPPPEFVP